MKTRFTTLRFVTPKDMPVTHQKRCYQDVSTVYLPMMPDSTTNLHLFYALFRQQKNWLYLSKQECNLGYSSCG